MIPDRSILARALVGFERRQLFVGAGSRFPGRFNAYGFRHSMVVVSLRGLKDVVRNLPGNDPLRLAVESQPDVLPAEEFIVLAKAWDRLAARR